MTTVLENGKYYEDITYNEQFQAVMNGTTAGATEVPVPTVADNGKFLTVAAGETAWGTFSGVLESTVGDYEKVLAVDNTGEPVWIDARANMGFPTTDDTRAGEILTVDNAGDIQWTDEIPEKVAPIVVGAVAPVNLKAVWINTTAPATPLIQIYDTDNEVWITVLNGVRT